MFHHESLVPVQLLQTVQALKSFLILDFDEDVDEDDGVRSESFSDMDDIDELLFLRKRQKPERLEDHNALAYRD